MRARWGTCGWTTDGRADGTTTDCAVGTEEGRAKGATEGTVNQIFARWTHSTIVIIARS